MIKISQDEFELFSQYIKDISGIILDHDRACLLEARLAFLLEEYRCTSFAHFYAKIKADSTRRLERQVIDAITTRETFFFRDTFLFDLMKYRIVPDLLERKTAGAPKGSQPAVRIWSAGCATGQEVYSMAILIKEMVPDPALCDFRILGTDISDAAIARALNGRYNKYEVERGLPKERLTRYFDNEGGNWKIKDEIRSMVGFMKHNLMTPLTGFGKFDVVLCRNVAIYFSTADRTKLFDRIAEVLEPHGYLVVGSSESLAGITNRFEYRWYLRSIFYQPRP